MKLGYAVNESTGEKLSSTHVPIEEHRRMKNSKFQLSPKTKTITGEQDASHNSGSCAASA
jgi:hypothetical protein